MNSNVDRYLAKVIEANTKGLKEGKIALSESLPCLVCRELEAPGNSFIESREPLISSYRAMSGVQHLLRPVIPRKIDFGAAVYFYEGIIDSIFPNSPVTLIFVGDGNSDKRFAYNSQRLFSTFRLPFRSHCFILNPDLTGTSFGNRTVKLGWDEDKLFYHAESWNELSVLTDLIAGNTDRNQRFILVIDLDGTLLCARPKRHSIIKEVRKKAIAEFCEVYFDDQFFSLRNASHKEKLARSYDLASSTGFSISYDDDDLTMLIALGLYAGLVKEDDVLLNPSDSVGFVAPIEWLQYAAFVIDNDPASEYELRRLRSLYLACADAIQAGSPTAFVEFREAEEKVLIEEAKAGNITLNRPVIEFLREGARREAVPIGFSDRPNASLGLKAKASPAHTATASHDAFLHTPLMIAAD
jgi:hypothetical protein